MTTIEAVIQWDEKLIDHLANFVKTQTMFDMFLGFSVLNQSSSILGY